MPHDADRHPSLEPYSGQLLPLDRAAYRASSPGVDLSPEIRLLRALLSDLAGDLSATHHDVARVLAVLVRAVSLQSRRARADTNLDTTAGAAAEEILKGYGHA